MVELREGSRQRHWEANGKDSLAAPARFLLGLQGEWQGFLSIGVVQKYNKDRSKIFGSRLNLAMKFLRGLRGVR